MGPAQTGHAGSGMGAQYWLRVTLPCAMRSVISQDFAVVAEDRSNHFSRQETIDLGNWQIELLRAIAQFEHET